LQYTVICLNVDSLTPGLDVPAKVGLLTAYVSNIRWMPFSPTHELNLWSLIAVQLDKLLSE